MDETLEWRKQAETDNIEVMMLMKLLESFFLLELLNDINHYRISIHRGCLEWFHITGASYHSIYSLYIVLWNFHIAYHICSMWMFSIWGHFIHRYLSFPSAIDLEKCLFQKKKEPRTLKIYDYA